MAETADRNAATAAARFLSAAAAGAAITAGTEIAEAAAIAAVPQADVTAPEDTATMAAAAGGGTADPGGAGCRGPGARRAADLIGRPSLFPERRILLGRFTSCWSGDGGRCILPQQGPVYSGDVIATGTAGEAQVRFQARKRFKLVIGNPIGFAGAGEWQESGRCDDSWSGT